MDTGPWWRPGGGGKRLPYRATSHRRESAWRAPEPDHGLRGAGMNGRWPSGTVLGIEEQVIVGRRRSVSACEQANQGASLVLWILWTSGFYISPGGDQWVHRINKGLTLWADPVVWWGDPVVWECQRPPEQLARGAIFPGRRGDAEVPACPLHRGVGDTRGSGRLQDVGRVHRSGTENRLKQIPGLFSLGALALRLTDRHQNFSGHSGRTQSGDVATF